MRELLALPEPPDAVFVADNLMTIGVLDALREADRTPPGVGVLSFGDVPWASPVRPSLTAVELPSYELGRTAADLLLQRMEGDTAPLQTVAAAGRVRRLCRAEGIPLTGGGGTDLRAGFAEALASRPRPDDVVLTDGQTPWPDTRPPCRTVVGLFPREHASWDEDDPDHVPDTPPDWARVVTVGAGPGVR